MASAQLYASPNIELYDAGASAGLLMGVLHADGQGLDTTWKELEVAEVMRLHQALGEWLRSPRESGVRKNLSRAARVEALVVAAKELTESRDYAELVAEALQGWIDEE